MSPKDVDYKAKWKSNPMLMPFVDKVVLNIGIGVVAKFVMGKVNRPANKYVISGLGYILARFKVPWYSCNRQCSNIQE